MSNIIIKKIGITKLDTEAIVNAANTGLWEGGGVCGVISAGIFGYPIDKAWKIAISACNDFINNNIDYDIDIVFAVLDDEIMKIGEGILNKV